IGVRGLLNIQFAIRDQIVYVIEANPRASRTVPFVSKATGVPLAKAAARIMAGESIADLGLPPDDRELPYFACKEAVMPFGRFPGSDVVLGPEMKSTGEVMGVARSFPAAYMKTQLAVGYPLPATGTVFISVADRDKRSIVSIARDFERLGFSIASTAGTAKALKACDVACDVVRKFSEEGPHIGTMIAEGKIDLMITTPFGHGSRGDGYELRLAAVRHGLPYATTLAGAQALAAGIEVARAEGLPIIALQDLGN
ncbi:MAG: carbamoyl phosphate synthase large subunit, partial [Eggerthellaceae bacterium]|nr:carbamoyl phosphate synthase large subunit [Eggerthellaceae bacterium]